MNDILPEVSLTWQFLEAVVRDIVQSYGYSEIRLPLLEQTELFKRSIGEVTDIVEKEMYTFEDRGGESLTLRPEATAGMVRAGISNGLLHNQRQKLWTAESRSAAAIGNSISSMWKRWDTRAPTSMLSSSSCAHECGGVSASSGWIWRSIHSVCPSHGLAIVRP